MRTAYSLSVLLGFCLFASAKEEIIFPYPGDWNDNPLLSRGKNGILLVSHDYAVIASTRIFRIDPAKQYRLSGSFRARSGKPGITLALRVYDENRREIKPNDVCPVPGSDTVLAAACRAEDRFLLVEDGNAIRRGVLVYETKPDFRDLPNRKQIPGILPAEKQPDGKWKIRFRSMVGVDLPAGTGVRAHYGYLPQITGGRHTVSAEWKHVSGEVSGTADSGPGGRKWRRGAAYAQVLLIKNGKNTELEFRDIKWEEIPGKNTGE